MINDDEDIKKFYNTLVQNESEFQRIIDLAKARGFTFESPFEPFEKAPKNHYEALFAWYLAMKQCPNVTFKDDIKVKWQKFWYRCCLSSKCDIYFLSFLKLGLKIDREYCLLHLIGEESLLRKYVGPYGTSLYQGVTIRFLLKRYSLLKAFKCARNLVGSKWPWVHLLLVRSWGANFIGILPLVTQGDMWDLPKTFSQSNMTWCVLIALVAATFLYLCYECRNLTEYGPGKVMIRSLCILAISTLQSFFIAYCISWLLYRHFHGPEPLFWQTVMFFTAASMFIGILLQVFWDDKTLAEPL